MKRFDAVDKLRIMGEARANLERLQDIEKLTAERQERAYERDAFETWRRQQPEEPEPPPPEPKLDTRRHNNNEWADWERWCDARCDARIERALVAERAKMMAAFEGVAEGVSDLLLQERRATRNDLAEQIKSLRLEVTALEETLTELKSINSSERAKIIDMPHRKAN
jgi:hypothetical protein